MSVDLHELRRLRLIARAVHKARRCEPLDQVEVGVLLGMSRGRVYQIEKIAIGKLRLAMVFGLKAGPALEATSKGGA